MDLGPDQSFSSAVIRKKNLKQLPEQAGEVGAEGDSPGDDKENKRDPQPGVAEIAGQERAGKDQDQQREKCGVSHLLAARGSDKETVQLKGNEGEEKDRKSVV